MNKLFKPNFNTNESSRTISKNSKDDKTIRITKELYDSLKRYVLSDVKIIIHDCVIGNYFIYHFIEEGSRILYFYAIECFDGYYTYRKILSKLKIGKKSYNLSKIHKSFIIEDNKMIEYYNTNHKFIKEKPLL